MTTPVTTLPANGVTVGATQVTGTALRVSARSSSGECTLALIRMNSSGVWFRVTDVDGQQVEMNLRPGQQGNTDYDFTLPAEGASEWYHLLLDGGSSFTGYAEILSLSAPPAAGGTVPSGRLISTGGGITGGGDLSADRTLTLGGTADMTLSTGALGWAGAAGKAGSLVAGIAAALTLGSNGNAIASLDAGGLGLLLAAGKVLGFGAPQALSGAGAVNVTTLATLYTSSAGPDALTLANGVLAGQIKFIMHIVDGGSGVLTPATPTGFATVTFTNVRDWAALIWTGAAWAPLAYSGAVFA